MEVIPWDLFRNFWLASNSIASFSTHWNVHISQLHPVSQHSPAWFLLQTLPSLENQNLWGWGPDNCILNKLPQDVLEPAEVRVPKIKRKLTFCSWISIRHGVSIVEKMGRGCIWTEGYEKWAGCRKPTSSSLVKFFSKRFYISYSGILEKKSLLLK